MNEKDSEIFVGSNVFFHINADIDRDIVAEKMSHPPYEEGIPPKDKIVGVIYGGKIYVTKFDSHPFENMTEELIRLNDNLYSLWVQSSDFKHNKWKIL